MKEIVQNTGARKYFGEDFLGMQDTYLSLLEGFYKQYGNFVHSGCVLSSGVISQGVVMLGGKLCLFSGTTGVSGAFYVRQVVQQEEVEYKTGNDVGYNIYIAEACSATDAGAFRLDNANRFENVLNPAGNGSNLTATFTPAGTRINLATGDKLSTIFGKLMKWFSDFATVAFTGKYSDLSGVPISLPANGGTADSNKIHRYLSGDMIEIIASNYAADTSKTFVFSSVVTNTPENGYWWVVKVEYSKNTNSEYIAMAYKMTYASVSQFAYIRILVDSVDTGWVSINDNGNATTVNGKTHRDYDTARGVMLNSLLWDTGNIADYVTFDNANRAAAAMGKRLPTQAEWAALVALPNAWDGVLKGTWIAATAADLATKDKTKCLFLPAAGRRNFDDGAIQFQASYGRYWSSTQIDSSTSYNLAFDSGGSNPANPGANVYGMSIRCVQDDSAKLLDADTLGGRKFDIYVQSTEPTNSTPGDIWIKP